MNLETQIRAIVDSAPDCVETVAFIPSRFGGLIVILLDFNMKVAASFPVHPDFIEEWPSMAKVHAARLQAEHDAGEREKQLGAAEREGELLANSNAKESQ